MADNENLDRLYQNYLAGDCTVEDVEILFTYFNAASEDDLKRLILAEIIKTDEVQPASAQESAKLEEIKKLIDHKIKLIKPATRQFLWQKIVGLAASLIIVALFSIWAAHHNKTKSNFTRVPSKEDLLPGSNKAVLTLANGKSISLNSINNGTIARQNFTLIEKTGDGRIIYKSGKKDEHSGIYNTVSTPRGGEYELTLSDGTKVILDAASAIRYPVTFDGNERRVEVQGQAYFEVAHDAKKPFFVTVKGQEIEVLGTHFNVNAYDDELDMRTSLLEGRVKITYRNKVAILKPGQQSIIDGQGGISLKLMDPEETVAWKNGYFEFNKADIKTIMRQLGRWYDVDVVYEGTIPDRKFSGELDRRLKASSVLEGLSFTNVHFTIKGKKIIVEP